MRKAVSCAGVVLLASLLGSPVQAAEPVCQTVADAAIESPLPGEDGTGPAKNEFTQPTGEALIHGIVTTNDGEPVADVEVIYAPGFAKRDWFTKRDYAGAGKSTTGPNGRFRIDQLNRGSGELLIRRNPYRPGPTNGSDNIRLGANYLKLPIETGGPFQFIKFDPEFESEFALLKPAQVSAVNNEKHVPWIKRPYVDKAMAARRGKVVRDPFVDQAGNAVRDARFWIEFKQDHPRRARLVRLSGGIDPRGDLVFRVDPKELAGKRVSLTVTAPGHSIHEVLIDYDQLNDKAIVLPPDCVISGRFGFGDGLHRQASLTLLDLDDFDLDDFDLDDFGLNDFGGQIEGTKSRFDGSFAFEGLRPNKRYLLMMSHPTFAMAPIFVTSPAVGEQADFGSLEVTEPRTLTLRFDASLLAEPPERVTASLDLGHDYRTKIRDTTVNGTDDVIVMERLAPVVHRLRIHAAGSKSFRTKPSTQIVEPGSSRFRMDEDLELTVILEP